MWFCQCECGGTVMVSGGNLRSGRQGSCGCVWMEKISTQDGFSKTPEYASYKAMMSRCYRVKDASYPYYGGKGITVCDEWRDNFSAFLRDMGPRPSPEHSIERKHVDKGYSKENCCWATKKEQANNRSTNLRLTLNGQTKTLMQWCEEYGISHATVSSRLAMGWSLIDALTKPVAKKLGLLGYVEYTIDGVKKKLKDWCGILDLDPRKTYQRIANGERFEDIIRE